jgi:imidazole glycerol phosphate synthase, glutamine amidotransferase subunit
VLVIVDYKAGNLKSVERACREVGVEAVISGDPEKIRQASRLIFPGVGAAGAAMASLQETGIDEAIREFFNLGRPVLGICLGLQISLNYSEENQTKTLDLISGEVKKFRLKETGLKIPHMGWNTVNVIQQHPVLDRIEPRDEFYFVHSYYAVPAKKESVYALTDYEDQFASVISKDNLIATQFHPEKSGRVGLRLLSNFLRWQV